MEAITGDDPVRKEWPCRDGTARMHVPEGKSFREYLREALAAELDEAGLYAQEGGVPIRIHLDNLRHDSVGTGHWYIQGTVQVGGGAPQRVDVDYVFAPAFDWGTGCQDTVNAYPAAVAGFNRDVFAILQR